jgi:hypothetical protein
MEEFLDKEQRIIRRLPIKDEQDKNRKIRI